MEIALSTESRPFPLSAEARALITFIVASPLFLARGLGSFDDTIFLKVGELMSQGYLPYRDVFDNKPPLLYVLTAIPALFGQNDYFYPRLFNFLFAIAFVLAVIQLSRHYYGELAAEWTSLFLPISYILSQGYSFHSEFWSAGFAFAGLFFLATKKPKPTLTGFLLGLSLLTRQTSVLYLLSAILWAISSRRSGLLLPLLLGFLLPLLFASLYLLRPDIRAGAYSCLVTNFLEETKGRVDIFRTLSEWGTVPIVALAFVLFPMLNRFRKLKTADFDGTLFLFAGLLSLLPSFRNISSTTHYLGAAVPFFSLALPPIFVELSDEMKFLRQTFVGVLLLGALAIGIGGGLQLTSGHLRQEIMFQDHFRNAFAEIPNPRVLALTSSIPRWHYLSGVPPYKGHLYYRWNIYEPVENLIEDLKQGKVPLAVVEIASRNHERQHVILPGEWIALQPFVRVLPLKIPPHLCPAGKCYVVVPKSRQL